MGCHYFLLIENILDMFLIFWVSTTLLLNIFQRLVFNFKCFQYTLKHSLVIYIICHVHCTHNHFCSYNNVGKHVSTIFLSFCKQMFQFILKHVSQNIILFFRYVHKSIIVSDCSLIKLCFRVLACHSANSLCELCHYSPW